jgi:lipopolysaccharide/colanic/teichoic acid biosynthesis glycosyltransferase
MTLLLISTYFIFVAYLTKVTSERRCCFDFVCVCVMNVRIQMTTLQTRRERMTKKKTCQWWTQNILACVPEKTVTGGMVGNGGPGKNEK